MNKLLLKVCSIIFTLIISLYILIPPVTYASEVSRIRQEQAQVEEVIAEVDTILAKPIILAEVDSRDLHPNNGRINA